MLHLILFFVFATVCLAAAVNLLWQSHPINSALSLIVVMGALAVLYLLLGAEFVAAIQIIVYAGAVMVLFVFVIMLLNAGEEEHTGKSYVAWFIGIPSVTVLVGLVVYSLIWNEGQTGRPALSSDSLVGSVSAIAHPLFKEFLLPFEVTSVLILIAIMGAVVLAKRGER